MWHTSSWRIYRVKNRIFTACAQLVGLSLVIATPAFAAAKATAANKPVDGAALYHNYCSVCHGDRGNGDSKAQGSLYPPPKDFSSTTNLNKEYMVAITREGKAGTAMVGWGTQLNAAEIEGVVDYIRNTFMRVALDPRLQRGKQVYQEKCVMCHGVRGNGLGPNVNQGMGKLPTDFSSPQARRDISRDRMLDAVVNGKSATAMISYRDALPKKDIEAVVDYIRAALMVPEAEISGTDAHRGRKRGTSAPTAPAAPTGADMSLPLPNGLKGDPIAGKKLFVANCATCHGDKGDGKGPRAYFINPRPKNFLEAGPRATLNRPTLYTFVSAGKLGTEMPAWSKVMTPQEIANVSEYVFRSFIQAGQSAAKTK